MIAFVVSNFRYNNTGAGGHYYTTFSLFQEIKKHRPSIMLVIGDRCPSAIDFSIDGILFIPVTRRLGKTDFYKINAIIKQYNISLLHAFDTYAFLFARFAGCAFSIRTILTKCGGPKPILYYYPGIRPDTVFSLEDLEYFSNRSRFFKIAPPVLLPNRVGGELDFKPISGEQTLPGLGASRSIKIIRIARISKSYELSFFQTIALVKELRAKGLDVILYIVGYIQDSSVFEEILHEMDSADYLLTEKSYTRNAARHLADVDIVIASGRGVMEASLSRKVILCSAKDAKFPYLLDNSNFLHFFRYNFSSRAAKPCTSENENIQNIIQVIAGNKENALYHEAMNKIHDQYFSISSAIASYFKLYDNDSANRSVFINTIDIGIHWFISVMKLTIRKLQNIKWQFLSEP